MPGLRILRSFAALRRLRMTWARVLIPFNIHHSTFNIPDASSFILLSSRSSSFQHGDRCTVSSFVFRARSPRRNRGMFAEMFADCFAERARSEAMNDANGVFSFQERPIEKAVG